MLIADRAALLVIDIQGKLAEIMPNKEATYANVGKLIKGAQAFGLPIIVTEQNKLGTTISSVAELLPEQSSFVKTSFSCWGSSAFREALLASTRKQVIITGLETHICVYQTARDLLREGWEVFVIADAVASRHSYDRRLALKQMRLLGAKVLSTEMALFEMLVDAEYPAARKIFEIVK